MKKNILTVDGETFLGLPVIDTSVALEVYDITPDAFPAVKKMLTGLYGDVNVTADGKETMLSGVDVASEIRIMPQRDFSKQRYNAVDALRVTARLTREGDGCPWDRAQTHESIRINMIEEAYEAVDAIDKRDREGMIEEFGDVLLQAIFQADIARRAGEFDESDVLTALCDKLVFRHRHIFGSEKAADAAEALKVWEEAKADEKREHTLTEKVARLPESFPSLLSAQKIAGKLEKAGASTDYGARYKAALDMGNYGEALYYLCAEMRTKSKDAEVELNSFLRCVKEKIAQNEKNGTLADLYKEE